MPVMKYVLICVCVKENVWFNGFFSQTDFWLSSAVAPAKLLSPHTLCTHFLCVCVCVREMERGREKRKPTFEGGYHNMCVRVYPQWTTCEFFS